VKKTLEILATLALTVTGLHAQSTSLPMNSSLWYQAQYNFQGNYEQDLNTSRGVSSVYFNIPDSSTDWWTTRLFYYTQKPLSFSTSEVLNVTFQVSTVGTPTFDWQSEASNTCAIPPAGIRPFFFSQLSKLQHNYTYEWWANTKSSYYILHDTNGTSVTLSVSFDPANWSSIYGVFGNQDVKDFTAALSNINYIGLSYGGGCFFGHGVSVNGGEATFTLQSLNVEQTVASKPASGNKPPPPNQNSQSNSHQCDDHR
jgi:hypothetical protein